MSQDVLDFIKSLGVGCRHPKDEFFRDGNDINKVHKIFGIHEVDEEFYHKSYSQFSCHIPGCKVTCETILEYDQHYNSCHRFSCSQCSKYLPSSHLLELHVTETHDTYFKVLSEKKPMFQCFLLECKKVFQTPQQRRDHCISDHKFPSNFRFDDAKKTTGKPSKKKDYKKNKNLPQDTKMELGNDGGTCEEEFKMEVQSDSNVSHKSKPRVRRNVNSGKMRQKIDLDCFVKDLKESLPS